MCAQLVFLAFTDFASLTELEGKSLEKTVRDNTGICAFRYAQLLVMSNAVLANRYLTMPAVLLI